MIQAFRTFPGIPGRFEVYAHPAGAECIVDYAHIPDGFNHFLKTLQTRKMGRLIHLFGFRGNSDPSKRESMLNITTGISGIVILTLDDTKGVNATDLIKEMKSMIEQRSKGCLYFIEDRTKAIEWAWIKPGKETVLRLRVKDMKIMKINLSCLVVQTEKL
ncbi:glutamate ligase domain-containing protein [Paenibacillus bovis]